MMSHDSPSPPPLAGYHPLPTPQIVDRYRGGVQRLSRALLELDDEALDTFFRPEASVGRWSCRALVGHLADSEIVFAHRLRRTAAEENPVVAGFDADAMVDAHLYADPDRNVRMPIAGFIAVIHTTRLWVAEWLATLPEHAWSRRVLHQTRGPFTLRTMLDLATWHLEHHVWYLDRKLRLLGVDTHGHPVP